MYPYVSHVLILQSSYKNITGKEGTGFQRIQILDPVKCLFLRSISTFAMPWKLNHFPNFRKAGLFFFFFPAVILHAKGNSDKEGIFKKLISTNTVSERETLVL